jgi:hypothetical protein
MIKMLVAIIAITTQTAAAITRCTHMLLETQSCHARSPCPGTSRRVTLDERDKNKRPHCTYPKLLLKGFEKLIKLVCFPLSKHVTIGA